LGFKDLAKNRARQNLAEQSHAIQPEQIKKGTLPIFVVWNRTDDELIEAFARGGLEKKSNPRPKMGGMEGGESAGALWQCGGHPHCYCQVSRLADRDNHLKGLRQWPEGLVGREIFGVGFLACLQGNRAVSPSDISLARINKTLPGKPPATSRRWPAA
jgi:hypothetical protein